MRLLRTFVALVSVGTFAVGATACGDDDSDEPSATTTTGLTPQEVEDPGEGDTIPGDPNTPDPGTGDPGPGVGGEQSNPY